VSSQAGKTEVTEVDAKIQPLKNGVKFLIKSKMSGEKALYWNEPIGNDQFRLRIQNSNAHNQRAWFMFDSRTATIRSALKTSYVISNQLGQGYKTGKAAVVRPWKGETQQRLHFYSGCKRNIRNDGGFCLDVQGGRNANNQPVQFHACNNGDNQGWGISQLKIVKTKDVHGRNDGKYPLKDGVKFIIRSELAGHWMLVAGDRADQIKVQTEHFDPSIKTGRWFFDSRTRTIRNAFYNGYTLSNARGSGYQLNIDAVLRRFHDEDQQKLRFFGGKRRNIRNFNNYCLEVKGKRDARATPVVFNNCNDHAATGWRILTVGHASYGFPLKDGIPFMIRSQMAHGRNLMYAEHIGRGQYRLRIENFNARHSAAWWVFDRRTRTIRARNYSKYVISNQAGQGYNIGKPAVIREWRNENYQRIRVYGGTRKNIRNDGNKCLDVSNHHNSHHRAVWWWNCHLHPSAGWTITQIKGGNLKPVVQYIDPPIKDGRKFQFRNSMKGGRALFYSTRDIGNRQFEVKIQDHAPWNRRQWFVFDRRTKSVRAAYERNLAISRVIGTRGWANSNNVVARQWINSVYQRSFFNRQHQIQDWGNYVITPHGFANRDQNAVAYWMSRNHAAQRWKVDVKGIEWPKQPLKDGVKFQLKTKLKSNRALFWSEHIGGH